MVSRTNKFRGRSRYHGRGKKAGRGAGKRGGRGNAGINKHRLMTRLKYMPNHWGMHGFNRDPSLRTVHNSINVSQVDQMIDEATPSTCPPWASTNSSVQARSVEQYTSR